MLVERNIFENISPLDHRYSLKQAYGEINEYLSERARIKYMARVELALVKILARRGICAKKAISETEKAIEELTVEEVYEEEKKTRHDIRALVNSLQKKVSEETRPYIHFTATSYDIVDSARALIYKKVTEELLIPALKDLMQSLITIASNEKEQVQIGRTHGQHAVPITFGFTIAEYISRLGSRLQTVERTAVNLRGKISGAVGAYNASSLFFSDPEKFEKEVLAELGLKPSPISTQIVEAEYLLDYIHALISCFGVLASFSDDMRHLQRSEIAEVGEYFDSEQVGSSTMPHKRNPINYENVKSMWKEFMPRMNTVYMDQISEHQRDLTNSATARFIPEIITGLYLSVKRLTGVVGKMAVDKENLTRNFVRNGDLIAAEPLYILLASAGHPDAHEEVRKLTLEAEKKDKPLWKLVHERKDLQQYWQNLSSVQQELIKDPAHYTGIAAQKTEKIINYWQDELNL